MSNSVAIGVAYTDQAISGGSVDGSPIGATTPSTVAATTLSTSGAATLASATITGAAALNGNTAIGNATSDTVGFYGVTGIAQRAIAAQATLVLTAVVSGSGGFSFSTSDQFNAFANQLAEVCATLKLLGLWKGGA